MTQPHIANHYTHFLTRLNRVSEDHLELAMALYTDHELLRAVLDRANVPDGAERIAIALGSRHAGPYVVVTRGGAFVTCLGEHMKPKGLHLVTRDVLETAGEKLERMRERLARVRRLSEDPTRESSLRWINHLDLAQTSLAREDVALVARWEPILGGELHALYLFCLDGIAKSVHSVLRVRTARPSSHDEERLHAFWRLVWMTSNLHVFANMGDVHGRCALASERGSEGVDVRSSTSGTWAQPVMQTSARSIWSSMLHVSSVLDLAERVDRKTDFQRTICDTTLAAIAMGSRSGRARALRLLHAPLVRNDDAVAYDDVITPILHHGIRDPEAALDAFTASARARVAAERGLAAHEVPDDVARACALMGPSDWLTNDDDRRLLAQSLPWLACADASELFAPRAWSVNVPYSTGRAVRLVQSFGRALGIDRTPIRRGVATPDRNDRCACGSGQKYKRCCMRVPVPLAA